MYIVLRAADVRSRGAVDRLRTRNHRLGRTSTIGLPLHGGTVVSRHFVPVSVLRIVHAMVAPVQQDSPAAQVAAVRGMPHCGS